RLYFEELQQRSFFIQEGPFRERSSLLLTELLTGSGHGPFPQFVKNLVFLFYVKKQARLKNNRVAKNDMFSPLVYVDVQVVDNNSLAVWVAVDKIIANKKS